MIEENRLYSTATEQDHLKNIAHVPQSNLISDSKIQNFTNFLPNLLILS